MFTEHENEWSGFLKETIRYKNPPILSVLPALELQTKVREDFTITEKALAGLSPS